MQQVPQTVSADMFLPSYLIHNPPETYFGGKSKSGWTYISQMCVKSKVFRGNKAFFILYPFPIIKSLSEDDLGNLF